MLAKWNRSLIIAAMKYDIINDKTYHTTQPNRMTFQND